MNLLIDAIYEFYKNPQNLADFERWKEGRKNDDAAAKEAQPQTSAETGATGLSTKHIGIDLVHIPVSNANS